jgi:soluble lytic murein transglycosylase-like protein
MDKTIMNIQFHSILFVFATLLVLVGCTGNPQQPDAIAVPLSEASKMHLRGLATQAAFRHGIDHRLFHALIKHESAWNPRALSRKGARGLTQIMPMTGRSQCGLKRNVLFDPKMNLDCGAFYFSKLLRRFRNVRLALAAYNSGETRVARLGRVPRIRETQRYVKRVMKSWRQGG